MTKEQNREEAARQAVESGFMSEREASRYLQDDEKIIEELAEKWSQAYESKDNDEYNVYDTIVFALKDYKNHLNH